MDGTVIPIGGYTCGTCGYALEHLLRPAESRDLGFIQLAYCSSCDVTYRVQLPTVSAPLIKGRFAVAVKL